LMVFLASFAGYASVDSVALDAVAGAAGPGVFVSTLGRLDDHASAADAAFTVGNDQGPDATGQTWPTAHHRLVSVGDVIKVTDPYQRTAYLSVDGVGFTEIPEPTVFVTVAPVDFDLMQ
ncbi:hypothetical protein ACWFR4_47780, partial [Streptomyces sp. NPDC055140]